MLRADPMTTINMNVTRGETPHLRRATIRLHTRRRSPARVRMCAHAGGPGPGSRDGERTTGTNYTL